MKTFLYGRYTRVYHLSFQPYNNISAVIRILVGSRRDINTIKRWLLRPAALLYVICMFYHTGTTWIVRRAREHITIIIVVVIVYYYIYLLLFFFFPPHIRDEYDENTVVVVEKRVRCRRCDRY